MVHVTQVSLLLSGDLRCTKQRQRHLKAMLLPKHPKSKHLSFDPKRKLPKKMTMSKVTIYIGVKRFDEEDLKPYRGKHLPIAVPTNATYATILEKAIAKWKAFDRRFDTTKSMSYSMTMQH